jgi:hypothetical protein
MNTTEILKTETSNRFSKRFLIIKPKMKLWITKAVFSCLVVISLRALPAHAANLLINGSFESGALTPWEVADPPLFDGEVTDVEAHLGTHSLLMDVVDCVFQDLETPTRCKRLRFWAKPADPLLGATGPAWVTVYYTDGSSSSLSFGGELSGGSDWTEFELLLFKPKFVTQVEFWVWETEPIYIDNVALIER